MDKIIELYQDMCLEKDIHFQVIDSVRSYDTSTLFCPAGMQKYKNHFKDESITNITNANIQTCLRINDIEEVGDGTHFSTFRMIGLFSFRSWSVEETVDFFMNFINNLNIKLTHVTIHPSKQDWKLYYDKWNIEVIETEECIWSDGEIGGYCTEFFVGDLEIGNIVNPLGTCIDVGFGLERLMLCLGLKLKTDKISILTDTVNQLFKDGYKPGNKKSEYVLRKLIYKLIVLGVNIDNPLYLLEVERFQKNIDKYEYLKDKYIDMSKNWWWDTHGIDIKLINNN